MTQAPAPIPLFDQDHETMAAAFEASATGICFLDSEGTLLRVNGALCDMLGHAPGTLNGRPWTVLAPPSLAARGTAFLASIAPDSALTSEWALTRADGSRLNAFVTVRSLVLANGTRRFMASFSDLDQRRDAEQKSLSRSNDLYRTVVEYVGEAIIIVQDGRISYANPRASELSGYNNHELLDKPFYSLIHPQDLARTVDRYQRSMAGMPISGRHAQFRILRRDGAERHVESSAVRIEREGRPALLAFLSDQTERQRQDMALMKSEQRHRQVVDNATEGIVVIQDGVIVFANRRTAEMAGVSIEQLQGRPFAATLHPNDQTAAAERYWRRLQGEPVPPNGVVRLHNLRTKAYVWLDVSVVMIDWEGRPATLSFLTDISARKALEDRLKQSLEERDTIVENAILGMVFLNPNGRVNWANGAMYQIFGVEPGTPTGSLERFYP
ncbi:MAG TPA: PAS domain S-box protein, partial [Noviherbaspirillum sp.]|nr:PAS domain S-box protein [Noviherbaspirillum sp.]